MWCPTPADGWPGRERVLPERLCPASSRTPRCVKDSRAVTAHGYGGLKMYELCAGRKVERPGFTRMPI